MITGNGLSVAANPKLELSKLTQEILSRLQNRKSAGAEYASALLAIAKRHSNSSEANFEELVGALHHQNASLATLQDLASVVKSGDEGLLKAISETNSFVNRMSEIGIAVILQTIDEFASNVGSGIQIVDAFLSTLMDTNFDKIDIANLNYDSILLTALVSNYRQQLLDMGDGSLPVSVRLRVGNSRLAGYLLRNDWENAPDRRIRLIHLHGSTLFWRALGKSEVVKIRNADLRGLQLFDKVLAKTINAKPVVVLTNTSDKSELIKEEPFKFAYQTFEKSLEEASHILTIGYSFRDTELNKKLALEVLGRGTEVKILVVTKGRQISPKYIRDALSRSLHNKVTLNLNLTIIGKGIRAMPHSEKWHSFKSGI